MSYIAPNTTSGHQELAGGPEEGRHHLKHAQDFEKNSDAINHTPYTKYQNSILGRNKRSVQHNISHLKQD